MSDNKEICSQCRKIHVSWANGRPACKGHIQGSDPLEPCTKLPIAGGTVCRSHGAALPNVQRAARERLSLMSAQGEIAELMRECDIPEQHPVEGLLEVVRVSGAMHRLLTIKVGELAEEPTIEEVYDDDIIGMRKVAGPDGFWGANHHGEMVPHTYVTLLKMWSERYERACKTALDAGIAERQVKLAEQQGELVATAIKGVLHALNLTPEQWKIAPRVVEQQMRLVSSGTVIDQEGAELI